jgi:hypothetical protein
MGKKRIPNLFLHLNFIHFFSASTWELLLHSQYDLRPCRPFCVILLDSWIAARMHIPKVIVRRSPR